MKLIWKFNLVLLGVFIIGLYRRRLRLQKDADGKRARRGPAARAADDGGGAGVAHLYEHADQAAARTAAEDRVPAADGTGVRGHRAVQRPAQDLRRLHLQGGDAQSVQPARPRERLGSRRRPDVPQHADHDRDRRRARDADGAGALPRPADPDQERAPASNATARSRRRPRRCSTSTATPTASAGR